MRNVILSAENIHSNVRLRKSLCMSHDRDWYAGSGSGMIAFIISWTPVIDSIVFVCACLCMYVYVHVSVFYENEERSASDIVFLYPAAPNLNK